MSDDLLRALGRQQRADLERERDPSSSDDDELSRPFDEDERAAILDGVFDRVEETASQASAAEPGEVVQLASRRRVALVGSLLAAAAAAALVVWAWPERGPEHGPIASVPDYTFASMQGGIAEQRAAPTGPTAELKLHPDSDIDWVLTPARPIRDPLGVALLARSDAGELRFVGHVDAEISDAGAVRLQGPLDHHVVLVPGDWTLRLFIAAPDELPRDADEASEHTARWRSVAVRVIVTEA
jgi:hypothetical protein